MPRTETVLTIFVASPSDVADERQRMEEIVREVNQTVGLPNSVRIDLIKWETRTVPSAGIDAQEIINRQVGTDYDIFVGIMWTKFGSATGRFDSGTEEEFHIAKQLFDRGSLLDIMFYFKDEPISPSKIVPDQLGKVNAFREKIEKSGIYHWPFKGIDEFERAFRMHLSKKIVDFKQRDGSQISIEEKRDEGDEVEEDFGVLDLEIKITNEIPNINIHLNRISEKTIWMSERLDFHARDLGVFFQGALGVPSVHEFASLINLAAHDMEEYASSLDEIGHSLSGALNQSFRDIVSLISMHKEFDMGGKSHEVKTEARDLVVALARSREKMQEFMKVMEATPRMTSELNSAKKHVLSAVRTISAELEAGERLLIEVLD